MTSLWFCTPAWERYDLSEIVFEQRRWAIDRLVELGVEASCVVVADDRNLGLAREQGFATIDRDNRYLGRRFNDAYQFAAAEGVDYVCPIGSDSWVDPLSVFAILEAVSDLEIGASRNYSVVDRDGLRRTDCFVNWRWTLAAIPTELLRPAAWRPCDERIRKGCDTSMMKSLERAGRVRHRYAERHQLELVAFQSDVQITSFDRLHAKWGCGAIVEEPFSGLAEVYPPAFVDRVEALYEARR